MKRIVNTKFFTFPQNNSGGYFVTDEKNGVGIYIIIEEVNAKSAWNKLNIIGEEIKGFWSACSCCGDRWQHLYDDDGEEKPCIFGKEITEEYDRGGDIFIHYFDGTIKKV